MLADGLAVNDRPKRAAEVAHIIASVALLDHEVVARQSERDVVIELEVWLHWRQPFPCNRPPANDERQIAEPEWGAELTLQPRTLGSEIRIIDWLYSRVAAGVLAGPMGSAASPFIVDDAIVGLAQPLTEALNQLSRGQRRACDVIEELGRREDFYLHLAGGSCRRTAGAVFHNAHLPYKLSCANRAEKDGVAIEFPEYVDGTAEEAKNTVCRVSLSEEELPVGEVRASHYGPLDRQYGDGPDEGKLACLPFFPKPTPTAPDRRRQFRVIQRSGRIDWE